MPRPAPDRAPRPGDTRLPSRPAKARPSPPAPKAKADALDGPPFVTAKAWAVADGKTGKVLWGFNEAEARPMASTTKIMTAWLVLRLAADDPKVLDEVVTFSERADKTTGSSARLNAGEQLPVRELLYGLLLPSGNDAAVALAEHFGAAVRRRTRTAIRSRPLRRRDEPAGQGAGPEGDAYRDPHGLSRDNVSSARDLAALARDGHEGRAVPRRTSRPAATRCEVVDAGRARSGASTWTNTNRLLDIEGYDGVKTGTTTPAGTCLVASGRRGDDQLHRGRARRNRPPTAATSMPATCSAGPGANGGIRRGAGMQVGSERTRSKFSLRLIVLGEPATSVAGSCCTRRLTSPVRPKLASAPLGHFFFFGGMKRLPKASFGVGSGTFKSLRSRSSSAVSSFTVSA